jgi:hypothetical protein
MLQQEYGGRPQSHPPQVHQDLVVLGFVTAQALQCLERVVKSGPAFAQDVDALQGKMSPQIALVNAMLRSNRY